MSVREEREARLREREESRGGVGQYIFGAFALAWIVAQIITRVF